MILLDDRLSILVLFKLGHVVGNSEECLLAELTQVRGFLEHLNHLFLHSFLHDVPHVADILATADENVAVVVRDDPIVLLAGPAV